MIVTITGHRPQSLDGDFTLASSLWGWIAARIDLYLVSAGVTELRCGMAIGVDLLAAERAHLNQVPFAAYVPFEGQPSRWSQRDRFRYAQSLVLASRRVMVNEGGYVAWKMHARNRAMIMGMEHEPRSDALLAVWNGKKSGGTYQAIQIAEGAGIPIERIDPGKVPA